MIKASHDLGLGGGMVLAVPIPEQYEAAGQQVEAAIQEALGEVERRGVRGAEVGGMGGSYGNIVGLCRVKGVMTEWQEWSAITVVMVASYASPCLCSFAPPHGSVWLTLMHVP